MTETLVGNADFNPNDGCDPDCEYSIKVGNLFAERIASSTVLGEKVNKLYTGLDIFVNAADRCQKPCQIERTLETHASADYIDWGCRVVEELNPSDLER